MHTVKPERAILRAYQKNMKMHTENPKMAIPRVYQKNTSINKPNLIPKIKYEKWNRFVNSMNDFAATLSEEFWFKIRPPVSVVVEIVRNSQEIDVCINDINIGVEYLGKVYDLDRSNEDLVEESFDLMCKMLFNAKTKDATIEMKKSADVRIDNYDGMIEFDISADVHIDKYIDNIQRSSACKIWFKGVW